jgi:gas vesicle protein
MDENESHSGRGFFLGLVLGALAGAAAGVLWSPRPGAENREKLTQAISSGLGPNRSEAAARARDDLIARVENAREAFDEGASETRARMQRELDQSRTGES